MKEYEEVRSNLIAMLEELNLRLSRITNHVKHSDVPLEKDFAEQAAQNENDEVMDYLGNSARKLSIPNILPIFFGIILSLSLRSLSESSSI